MSSIASVFAGAATLICLLGGGGDGNVEWAGVSHAQFQDLRPLCPINNEAFDVTFRTFRFDITEARVCLDDGGVVSCHDAVFVEDRGAYAIWSASLPATTSTEIRYYIELTDGPDTDYYGAFGMQDDQPASGEQLVLNFDTLIHAPEGATLTSDGGAVFRVWAPSRTRCWARGEFNGWSLDNELTKEGSDFVGYVPNVDPRDQYKYFFEPGSNFWQTDARARGLNPSENYNAYAEDRFGYVWLSDSYVTPAFEDMIIYEMHVGTFSGRNDPHGTASIPATYRDAAERVDHLVDLGVTAVEVMPINEFPGDFSAGYNTVGFWSPEWKYGTPDDFKYFVDTLHANGIAVLVDVVWNHTAFNDNFLWFYDGTQIYFDSPAVDTPWGSQPDFDRPEVREFFLESAMTFLEEYRVDGFRMDATEFMDIQGGGYTLMQQVNDMMDNRYVDRISIAEQLPDDSTITQPTQFGGAGFDSQWHDRWNDNVRAAILDIAFGDPSMGAVAGAINGSFNISGTKATNYLESHDEVWPSSGGQRLVKTIDTTAPHDDFFAQSRHKLGHGLTLLAPGIPMFFQGAEWLEDTDFQGGAVGGSDRIDWSHKTTYAHIFQFFKDVIRVRKENGCFRSNAGWSIFEQNDGGNVIAFQRFTNDGNVCAVIANFSSTDYNSYGVTFPQAGTWYELINSQADAYQGNGLGNGGSVETDSSGFATMVIPQESLLVLRWNDPPTVPGCPGDPSGALCDTDVTDDCIVNNQDLGVLLAAYLSEAGDPAYNAAVNFSDDGASLNRIDNVDLGELLADYLNDCN